MSAPFFDGTQPCRGKPLALFFPDHAGHPGHHQHVEAVAVCQPCPFRGPCLQWALDHTERGVWGGTTERDRDDLRRQQRNRLRRMARTA